MDFITRVKLNMAEMFFSKGPNMSQCADVVGKSVSLLSRMISLSDDIPVQLEVAVMVMKHKKHYKLLHTIAEELGFSVIRLPRFVKSRKDASDISADYMKATSEAGDAVVKYLNKPSEDGFARATEALRAVISESMRVDKTIKQAHTGQMEINY